MAKMERRTKGSQPVDATFRLRSWGDPASGGAECYRNAYEASRCAGRKQNVRTFLHCRSSAAVSRIRELSPRLRFHFLGGLHRGSDEGHFVRKGTRVVQLGWGRGGASTHYSALAMPRRSALGRVRGDGGRVAPRSGSEGAYERIWRGFHYSFVTTRGIPSFSVSCPYLGIRYRLEGSRGPIWGSGVPNPCSWRGCTTAISRYSTVNDGNYDILKPFNKNIL